MPLFNCAQTGRDEVVLRRTINNQGGTQAKDIYTIDKNTVTYAFRQPCQYCGFTIAHRGRPHCTSLEPDSSKTEVFNLLESAGFSRSNPYYIVPQGRVRIDQFVFVENHILHN